MHEYWKIPVPSRYAGAGILETIRDDCNVYGYHELTDLLSLLDSYGIDSHNIRWTNVDDSTIRQEKGQIYLYLPVPEFEEE